MRIWTDKKGPEPILFIAADNDREAGILNYYSLTDKPLRAVKKHNPGYPYPHLEIRKENP